MLRGLKDKYEQHHKVIILDKAVIAAVQISKRYISGRFLPDKAVDLLDTAAARVGTGLNTRPAVLDDLDRRIQALDTAIAATKGDQEGGIAIEAATLTEMETSRTALLEEREKTKAHWKAELDAVNKVASCGLNCGAIEKTAARLRPSRRARLDRSTGWKPVPHPPSPPGMETAGWHPRRPWRRIRTSSAQDR